MWRRAPPRQPIRLSVRLCYLFVLVSLHVSGIIPEYSKLIFVPPSFVLTGYPTIHRITIKPKARSHTSADPACSPQRVQVCRIRPGLPQNSPCNSRRISSGFSVRKSFRPLLSSSDICHCQQSRTAFHHRCGGSCGSFLVCMSSSFLIIRSHVICSKIKNNRKRQLPRRELPCVSFLLLILLGFIHDAILD